MPNHFQSTTKKPKQFIHTELVNVI